MTRPRTRRLALRILLLSLLPLASGRLAAQAPATIPATLAGVVRDAFGEPIPSVEVLLLGANLATRSDTSGRFVLAAVPPGDHVVRFRRLGFGTVEIDWTAQADIRVEVAVRLEPLAAYLDPVIAYARETHGPTGTSSISGVVIDSLGQPLAEAQVQLVGAGRSTLSAGGGGFVFRRLPPGDYAVLVRRLGYAPATHHVRLEGADDRELTLRIRRLPATLDTLKIVDRSGFGRLESAYRDLEARQRWRGPLSVMIVGEDLRSLGKMTLDYVLTYRGGGGVGNRLPMLTREVRDRLTPEDEYCVLLNGRTPRRMNLRALAADQLDRIEIYPPGTDWTGTIGARMGASGDCAAAGSRRHPTYLVLWLKGGEAEP